MKRLSMVVVVVLALLLGVAPICSAERWVPILKQNGLAIYYDADSIGYHRDNIGDTPFVHVRVRDDITFASGVKTEINTYVYGEDDYIPNIWWRLEAALKQWRQTHPRR